LQIENAMESSWNVILCVRDSLLVWLT
jgi:hypothetical protein